MMERAERAKQFAPFSPLKGFEEAVMEKRTVICPRRVLSEEQAELLSKRLSRLSRGGQAGIEFYNGRGYESLVGRVKELDLTFKYLTLCGRRIAFEDVIRVWC